jgi:hypothetical protein
MAAEDKASNKGEVTGLLLGGEGVGGVSMGAISGDSAGVAGDFKFLLLSLVSSKCEAKSHRLQRYG